jgi:hypothetical protein
MAEMRPAKSPVLSRDKMKDFLVCECRKNEEITSIANRYEAGNCACTSEVIYLVTTADLPFQMSDREMADCIDDLAKATDLMSLSEFISRLTNGSVPASENQHHRREGKSAS